MRHLIFFCGVAIVIVALINMMMQWLLASDVIISENDMALQESVSLGFVVMGAYMIVRSQKKRHKP